MGKAAKTKRKAPPAMYQRWAVHNARAGILGGTLYHSRAEARHGRKGKGGSPAVLVTVVVAKAAGRHWK